MAEENNIGASRLLGTNGLQQAVDSLTTQVNKIAHGMSALFQGMSNMSGAMGKVTGGSQTGNNWNSNSNRANYSANGGGGNFFSTGQITLSGGRTNGGNGARFSVPTGGGRFAGAVGATAGVMAGFTAYGNKYMSTNMQMDMFNAQANVAGGGSSLMARHMVFDNNNLALDVNDAARAAYTNSYVFGTPQFGGRANPNFTRGFAQVQGFGYSSPTLGASAAANAAAQTYTARSLMMSQALGLRPTIGPGGVRTSMGDIAQSIYTQTFGNQRVSQRGFNAAISQGGSLAVNLQYMGKQMGWDQTTIMEYQNYLQGLNAAQNNGMSRSEYDKLSQQAANQDKNAINKLAKTTGLGKSMFETQRNLNATRVTRQSDILDSLAPAFNDATNSINNFSAALTAFLKNTGLDKMIGTGAGWGSALSSSLSGFSGGFGAIGGIMAGARLFGAGGGGLGGLGGLFGRGSGTAGNAGGLLTATRGADGIYTVSNLGGATGLGSLLARGGPYAAAGAAISGAGLLGWKGAVNSEASSENKFLQGVSSGLKGQPANPLGLTYLATGQARRIWDKINGKNKESIWSIFNPWGTEKRTTNIDGRSGGGSASNPSGGGGSSGGNGVTNGTGASGSQVIQFAETQLGVPYVWGGTTPGKGFDCSGLTQWAYGKAGINIPRTSEEQQNVGSDVSLNSVQAGDLLFKGSPAHHVAMAIGGGKLIEAPHTGLNVRIRSFSAGEFTNAKRLVGNVGNAGSLLNGNTGNAVSNTLSNSSSRVGGDTGDMSGISERSTVLSALSSSIGHMSSGSSTASGTAGTSQLGTTPTGNGGNDKSSLQAYARQLLAKYGWAGQWNSFDALVMSESGWDYRATNPSSGAYGIPQALPGSKMSSAGSDWRTSGDTQLRWMMDYVQGRYGDPNKAWAFHQKNNWYASGAWSIDQDQAAQVHKGEMILPAKQAETVRNAITNAITNKSTGSGMGGITIGSIQVNLPVGYSGTQQEAQATGKMIVDAIANDSRIKLLQRGQ